MAREKKQKIATTACTDVYHVAADGTHEKNLLSIGSNHVLFPFIRIDQTQETNGPT